MNLKSKLMIGVLLLGIYTLVLLSFGINKLEQMQTLEILAWTIASALTLTIIYFHIINHWSLHNVLLFMRGATILLSIAMLFITEWSILYTYPAYHWVGYILFVFHQPIAFHTILHYEKSLFKTQTT